MPPLPRLMPALITPFGVDGEIDADAHIGNVRKLAARGVEGVVLGGSTGEGPYLEATERAFLAAATREAAPGMAIVSGINAETIRAARAQIGEVADLADAVLVLTPTTLARDRHGIVTDFYAEVAELSPLPVLLYSNPPVTRYELPVSAIQTLAGLPNITGMKDSGGDVDRVDELRDEIAAGFSIYIGASRAVYAGVCSGAYGAITASANYAFAELRDLVAAAASGTPAGDLQDRLAACSAAVESHGVPGTKAAAMLCGLEAGRARAPLTNLTAEGVASVTAALRVAGIPVED